MNAAPPPSTPSGLSRQERIVQLRTLYYQAKTCYGLCIVFAICGFLLFASMYANRIAPDPIAAMRDFSTIGLIVAVFLPAVLLSFLAKKYEKKYLALLRQE